MGPSNDHELTIARMVDKFAIAGKLDPSAVELLGEILPLALAEADRDFLVKYVLWRMDHPIAK